MNESELDVITTNMVGVAADFGLANQLLVSSLVKYLADKQVIDLEDYLTHNQQTQEHLINVVDDERERVIIKKIFTTHRKNFEKPE